MRAVTLGLALAGGLLLNASVQAQRVETGFIDRSVSWAGQTYRYQVYVPADYASRSAWPVTLFLHGSGERGTDGMRQTLVGLAPAIRQEPQRFPTIAVFPQARSGALWTGDQAAMALAALKQTLAEYKAADADRVYLTGLSMGGHGSWYLAYRHPEVFAAVAPICGWITRLEDPDYQVPVVPPEDGAPMPALVRKLARTPIWIFHGEMDGAVPPSGSREPAAALKAVSTQVRYTEYLGLNHNSWDATYASDEFLRWLFAQKRGKS